MIPKLSNGQKMTQELLETTIEQAYNERIGEYNNRLDEALAYNDKKMRLYDFVKRALQNKDLFPENECLCPDNYDPWCIEGGSPLTGYIDSVVKLVYKNGIVWAESANGHRICYTDIYAYEGMVSAAYYLVAKQHPEINYSGETETWRERWDY